MSVELSHYLVVGAVEFYQRKEIKDIIAYLRVMANPRDALSLLRIINIELPRGVPFCPQPFFVSNPWP